MAKHQTPERVFFFCSLSCTQSGWCTCVDVVGAVGHHTFDVRSRWTLLLYFYVHLFKQTDLWRQCVQRQKCWQQQQQQLLNLRKVLFVNGFTRLLAVVSHTYLLFVCIYYFRSISIKWLLLYVCFLVCCFCFRSSVVFYLTLLHWTLSFKPNSVCHLFFFSLFPSKRENIFFSLSFCTQATNTFICSVHAFFALCHSFSRSFRLVCLFKRPYVSLC